MNLELLIEAIQKKQRWAIAQAITLVESSREEDQHLSAQLLAHLKPGSSKCLRIGVSGIPGVGKSTFINALLGKILTIEPEYHIACLTVDPSSPRHGGSILGDQVRMHEIAAHERVYVRSTPAEGFLGGTARKSKEALQILAAAGFDLCFVETVGVGQSESAVASMVDVLLLLLMPHTGDDIQWVKKGLQELADLVIFNKADGLLRETAEAARRDYMESLKFLASLPGARIPQVFLCSATEGRGLDEIWRGIIASTTK